MEKIFTRWGHRDALSFYALRPTGSLTFCRRSRDKHGVGEDGVNLVKGGCDPAMETTYTLGIRDTYW